MGDVTTFHNCWKSRYFCLAWRRYYHLVQCQYAVWFGVKRSYGMLLYLAHSDKGKGGTGNKWGDIILIRLLMKRHCKGL